MSKFDDFLSANPEAKAEYERELKAKSDAAAAKALEDKSKEKPAPATLVELKGIVPANMAGRSDMIVELQEKGATVDQA